MSHPNPSHDRKNEYPEDKVTRYPKKQKKEGGFSNVIKHLRSKTKALQKMMDETGGRYGKYYKPR